MKKTIGILCSLTVLTGCSTFGNLFGDDEPNKLTTERHKPTLNTAGVGQMPSMPAGQMPPRMPDFDTMVPPPPPGSPGSYASPIMPTAGQMPPSMAGQMPPSMAGQMPPSMPPGMPPMPRTSVGASADGMVSLPTGRRAPEFNRMALGAPSGDFVAPVPTAPVVKTSIASANIPPAPTPPVQPVMPLPPKPTAMPSGQEMMIPPPPPATASANIKPIIKSGEKTNSDEYPRLAQVPPSPPVPTPSAADPRVQQMKADLNSMNQQTGRSGLQTPQQLAATPAQLPKPGAIPSLPQPSIPTQMPEQQMAQIPPAPPQMPEPPRMPMAGQMPPVKPQGQGLMPEGPTVVVKSSRASLAPQSMEVASLPEQQRPIPSRAAPQMPSPPPGYVAIPIQPGQQLPEQQPIPSLPRPNAQPRMMVPPPAMPAPMAAPIAPSAYQQPSTSLSSLRPISVDPRTPVAASSDAPQVSQNSDDGYTNPASLKPITSERYRLLPESRYIKFRRGNNNGGSTY